MAIRGSAGMVCRSGSCKPDVHHIVAVMLSLASDLHYIVAVIQLCYISITDKIQDETFRRKQLGIPASPYLLILGPYGHGKGIVRGKNFNLYHCQHPMSPYLLIPLSPSPCLHLPGTQHLAAHNFRLLCFQGLRGVCVPYFCVGPNKVVITNART